MNYLDVKWLKANHQMIHYFGLGFIQLKIDQKHRMHFYTGELPAIVSEEDIHNHRYDFTSRVLMGVLEQEFFAITDGDTHVLEKESCKEGVCADTDGKTCGVTLLTTQITHGPRSSYTVDHRTFHRVRGTNCITLLERGEYKKELAEVVRPVGGPKVCPFSLKVPESELWDIVEDMLGRRARYV